MPSLQEGFGVVFLEAMAAGKPIVAARASVPEVVRHGILTDPESTESLAAGIETLYRNAGLCRSLGAAGRADVKRFDVHRVAASFISRMAKAVPAIKLEFPDTPVSDRAGAVIIQSASEDLHGGR